MELRLAIILVCLSTLAAGFQRPFLLTLRRYGAASAARAYAAKYDPFTSDPTLSAAVEGELESIRRLSAVIIKQELSESGIRTASMREKKDLEHALAVCRVKKGLKAKEDTFRRSKQAMMISDEVEKIKGMTDAEMIDELHKRGITLGRNSSREKLEGKLATARVVGIQYEEQKNSNLREDLAEIGQMIASGATKAASSGVGEKVINFAKARTFTDAELTASDFLKEQQPESGNTDSSSDDKSNGEGEKEKKGEQTSLTDEKLAIFEGEIAALGSFDKIADWAQDKPRTWLAQLLQSRGEHVPQYAPHSAVVRLLADSEMCARSMTSDEKGDKQSSSEASKVTPSQQEIAAATSAGVRGRRKASDDGWERSAIDTLDSFAFEKDLFTDLGTKMQRSTSQMLDSALELVSGEDTSAAIQSARAMGQKVARSSASSAIGDVIRRSANLGIDTTTKLGQWAGGSGGGKRGMLSSGQSTFIAAFYTILRRRGLPTFVGAFAVIRLYRLVMNLEEREREWEETQLGSGSDSVVEEEGVAKDE